MNASRFFAVSLAVLPSLPAPGAAALGVAGRVRGIPAMGTPAVVAVGAAPSFKPLSQSNLVTLLSGPSALGAPTIPIAAVPTAGVRVQVFPSAAGIALPRAEAAAPASIPARISPSRPAAGFSDENAGMAGGSGSPFRLPAFAGAAAAVSYGSAFFDGSLPARRANPVLPSPLPRFKGALSRASEGMRAAMRRWTPPVPTLAIASPNGLGGAVAASGWLAAGAALAAQFPLLEVLAGGMVAAAAFPLVVFLFGRHVPFVPRVSSDVLDLVTLPLRLGFPPEALRRSAWTLVLSLPILAVAWLAWSYPPFLPIRMGLAAAALGPLPLYLSVRLITGLFRALGQGWSDLAVSAFSLSAGLLIIGGGIFSGVKVLAALAPVLSSLGAVLLPELGMGLVLGATLPPLALLLWATLRYGLPLGLGFLPRWAAAPFFFLGHWLKGMVPPHLAADSRIVLGLVLLPAAAAGIIFLVSPASALIPGLSAAALLALAQFLLHNVLAGFAQAVFWATGARLLSMAILWFAGPTLGLSPTALGLGAGLLLAFPGVLALVRRTAFSLDAGRRDGKGV
ncbi:MAG: hypothetical protein FD126_2056 [Elusimicrobia bacterium]|nr:MAG: hypothetical protein FD126_2056 [Elusimicrobiota bacterium]